MERDKARINLLKALRGRKYEHWLSSIKKLVSSFQTESKTAPILASPRSYQMASPCLDPQKLEYYIIFFHFKCLHLKHIERSNFGTLLR